MRIKRIVIQLLMMALLLTASALRADVPDNNAAETRDDRPVMILDAVREQFQVPGLAVAIVKDGALVYAQSTGVRRNDRDQRIDITDRFHIGACTKSFTATLAAMLVEDGVIAWDDTIAQVFDGWKDDIHEQCRSITLEQLLTHRSGLLSLLQGGEREEALTTDLPDSPREQRVEFARRVLRDPPTHEPGSTFHYSNAGYAIAAAMLEERTGKDWQALITEHIFTPLRMTDSRFGYPAMSVEDNSQPWSHFGHEDRLFVIPPTPQAALPPILEAAGDISCSMPDLARFARMHLDALRAASDLLSAASAQRLHTPVLEDYAMGWFRTDLWGPPAHAHNGSAGTFFTWMAIWPEENLAIVAASNAGGPGDDACRETIRWMYRLYGEGDAKSADSGE